MNNSDIIRTRQTFYKTLYLLFKLLERKDPNATMVLEIIKKLGCDVDPEVIKDNAYEEIPNILGRYVRKDLDPATMKLYPMTINEFYRNAGYENESEKPDHIMTMLSFMIQLLNDEETIIGNEDEAKRIRRIQHRFLNIHLIPLLKNYEEENTPMKQLIKCIEKYLSYDLAILRSSLY